MISFVGAGPGDLDLITVKGRKLMEEADLVIYAGSLVSQGHLKFCREDSTAMNSASMTLEEVVHAMEEAFKNGEKVVRLHTGDPTIYGAIREQIRELERRGIPYQVIPGVSSFTAACAAINREFTLPGVSQTVILTRMEGRTPVPEREALENLARHQSSMAIFLSVKEIDKVVGKLAKGYGRWDVPVAVVYKASWEDQRILLGTLEDIGEKVRNEKIEKTAQILVGDFIGEQFHRSLLYDPGFSHMYRSEKG
ncbi:precorrin-4 C(11)-methyltransferase [Gudongella sp. SC589]|jgi:precorrin-4/cobalt-precorrin-4 C11-methyltransferase|uniref:precorrin-4 C(11)-methyltransferase n=1 Tax=Gudongella sp. SC589 TaxID=3385990 RepID=UPI003904B364